MRVLKNKGCDLRKYTCKFERGEWALVEAPQVVELDAFRVDAGGEDESFRVEGGDGPAGQLHEALALVRPQVPQPDGLVQGSGQEGVVGGGHGQGHHPLGVAPEIRYVLVLAHVEVTDRVVLLRASVDHVGL